MKAIRIFTAAFLAASSSLAMQAYDNNTAVKLTTTVNGKAAVISSRAGSASVITTDTPVDSLARWVIYENKDLNRTYVINLAGMKFLTSNGKSARLSTTPTVVATARRSGGGMVFIDTNTGGMFGFPKELDGSVVTLQTDSVRASDTFVITPRNLSSLTAAEKAAVAELCSTEAIVNRRIEELKQFVADAKAAVDPEMKGYIGIPDLDALEKAIAASAPLDELEAAYERAAASQFPIAGHYYRFHNTTRPSKGSKDNILTVGNDGYLWAENAPLAPGATGNRSENLALFTFVSSADAPSVAYVGPAAYPGYYLNNWGNTRLLTLDQATAMELDRDAEKFYEFRMRRTDDRNVYLTIGANNQLSGVTTSDKAQWWWLEEVKEFDVPVRGGVATVCLPCPVEVPSGVKAYVVANAEAKGATLVEIGSTIPANTPAVIVAGKDATAVTVGITPGDYMLTSKNILRGTLVANAESGDCFGAATDADGNLCFKRLSGSRRTANEAWLPVTEGMEAIDMLPVKVDATGIENVITAGDRTEDAEGDIYYDLQGRRLARPADRGVYINATTGRVRIR